MLMNSIMIHVCNGDSVLLFCSTENEGGNRDNVLLVAVLVPVLSVVVLAVLLVPVMVGGWRLWAKRCAHIHPHNYDIITQYTYDDRSLHYL